MVTRLANMPLPETFVQAPKRQDSSSGISEPACPAAAIARFPNLPPDRLVAGASPSLFFSRAHGRPHQEGAASLRRVRGRTCATKGGGSDDGGCLKTPWRVWIQAVSVKQNVQSIIAVNAPCH
eukprot:scaffold56577_cov37-Tisochrysis_lutea.AAC.5